VKEFEIIIIEITDIFNVGNDAFHFGKKSKQKGKKTIAKKSKK
jgi:hypothetical protein